MKIKEKHYFTSGGIPFRGSSKNSTPDSFNNCSQDYFKNFYIHFSLLRRFSPGIIYEFSARVDFFRNLYINYPGVPSAISSRIPFGILPRFSSEIPLGFLPGFCLGLLKDFFRIPIGIPSRIPSGNSFDMPSEVSFSRFLLGFFIRFIPKISSEFPSISSGFHKAFLSGFLPERMFEKNTRKNSAKS